MEIGVGLIMIAMGSLVIIKAKRFNEHILRSNEIFWGFRFPDALSYLSIVIVGVTIVLFGAHNIVVELFYPQSPAGLLTTQPGSKSPPDASIPNPFVFATIAIVFIVFGLIIILRLNRIANAQSHNKGIFGTKTYILINKIIGAVFACILLFLGLIVLLVLFGVIKTVS